MKKARVVTWTFGEASGFYIDFDGQTIGFKDKQKHLEYLQSRLLAFMLTDTDDFKTAVEVSDAPEIFSINLSKYIYEIKNKCLSVLPEDKLFDQIIEKKTINGKRGYRLRTELTDLALSREDPVELAPVQGPLLAFIRHNWFPLFIFLFLILGVVLIADSRDLTFTDLIYKLISLPFYVPLISLTILSALPVIAGCLIDARHGNFDNSRENIVFFLVCNLTGVFTVLSELLYAQRFKDSFSIIQDQDLKYAILAAGGILVTLYQSYILQNDKSEYRTNSQFLLTRAHSFLNLVYLSVALSLGAILFYAFVLTGFVYKDASLSVTTEYILLFLSGYCYLWFSAVSPAAEQIDSVSTNNFLAGVPLLSVASVIYTVRYFKADIPCFASLLISAVFMVLWAFCLIRRRQKKMLRLVGVYTSFFSIVVVFIVIVLILNALG